jgi:phosphate-selective porin OprO/OprP
MIRNLFALATCTALGGCIALGGQVLTERSAAESYAETSAAEAVALPTAAPAVTQKSEQPDAAQPPVTEPIPTPEPAGLKPNAHIRGRIQADAIWVNQSPTNKAALGNIDNAVGFRRARLGAQGTIGDLAAWVAEFEFAGGNIRFRDVYAELDELPWLRRFRVGHMREPFSLEGYTSSNVITFCERSPINALDPTRNWGVGVFSYTDDQRLVVQGGAFWDGTNSNTGDASGDANQMAYTVRMTGLPWCDDGENARLMHIGGAFSQRTPANDTVTIRDGPQNTLLNPADGVGSPFAPQIVVPATQQLLFNAQWATIYGPLSFQAEWSATSIDIIGPGWTFLNGCYAQASYFLTGEHRGYDRRAGKFDDVKVLSPFACRRGTSWSVTGWGAWEIAARYSYANYDSPNIPLNSAGQVQASRETLLTFGLNWYLNEYFRFMFNYDHAIVIIPTFGSSDADSFNFRTAVFW